VKLIGARVDANRANYKKFDAADGE